jgi:hypothetical protein
VVEVVREPDVHTALRCGRERARDELVRLRAERVVVDRDLECPLGALEERGEQLRDLDRGLPAVRERAKLDQRCARSFAL